MTPAEQEAAMRLELVSAKARQLAQDLQQGRLWEGDLARGLREICEQLDKVRPPAGR